MSMSTKIDDLPGIIPEEVRNDINQLEGNIQNINIEPALSNIQMDVKKRVEEGKEALQSEISEENMLLLAMFFLAATPKLTDYVRQIPFLGGYASNEMMTAALKAIVVLVLFVLAKRYVLPKFKV